MRNRDIFILCSFSLKHYNGIHGSIHEHIFYIYHSGNKDSKRENMFLFQNSAHSILKTHAHTYAVFNAPLVINRD